MKIDTADITQNGDTNAVIADTRPLSVSKMNGVDDGTQSLQALDDMETDEWTRGLAADLAGSAVAGQHHHRLSTLPDTLCSAPISGAADNLSGLISISSSAIDSSLHLQQQQQHLFLQQQLAAGLPSSSSSVKSTFRHSILSAAEFERYKTLHRGMKKFSMDGEKGIRYLVQHGYFSDCGADAVDGTDSGEPSAQAIAEFLYRERDMLSKRAIGEYLGEAGEKNIRVLEHYVRLQPFHHVPFDRALRQFLSTFRLPGEAQKIDRMMERFANWYVRCNPDHPLFRHPDIAYILAFSIIMLNTDLHNPAVKRKISKTRFIRNNFDVLCKTTPAVNVCTQSKTFLEYLYDCIQREPLSIGGVMQSGAAVAAGGAGDDSHLHDNLFFTFFNPEQEGFLYKQGGRMRSWKKRYCIVAGGCLYYFKHEVQTDIPNASCLGENCNVDDRPCGIIPLENLQIQHYRTKPLLGRERFYIKLSPTANADTASAGVSSSAIVKAAKTRSDGRMIAGRHRYYLFRCASADEQQDWLRSIETQMSQTTTPAAYQLYRERRKKLM